MNAMSASPADRAAPAPAADTPRRILVWDLPVRVFHGLMLASFAGAWLTAESERWRMLHVSLGWTMAGLVAFRLVWGLVGSRHARFASFVRGPRAVARYLRGLAGGTPEHSVGHNPAGGWAIVGLLGLAAAVAGSGWLAFADAGPAWSGEAHEAIATGLLLLVGVHVAGVLLSSRLHRENLVKAMVTGRKAGRPEDGLRGGARAPVAALLLAAVLGFWFLQWRDAPAPVGALHAGTLRPGERDGDGDGD